MKLAGISEATMERNQLREVEDSEALALCGAPGGGLWIPYFHLAGPAVVDEGGEYGRIRLAQAGAKKYHQRYGTTVHGYLPASLRENTPGQALHVVEGEKKALALTEAGFPAVGISGFYGFQGAGDEGGQGELAGELAEALEALRPPKVFFVGDNDTAFNFQFSVAACRIAAMLGAWGTKVWLPRIPINRPKGADDCREADPEGFYRWWETILAGAVEVNGGTQPGKLAMELFQREAAVIDQAPDKERVIERLVSFGAAVRDTLQMEKIATVAESLGIKRAVFRKAVHERAKARPAERSSLTAYYDMGKKSYWVRHGQNYIDVSERAFLVHVAKAGYSRNIEDGQAVSEAESLLASTQKHQAVAYAGPLAGWDSGLQTICDNRVLVTSSPKAPVAAAGDWPTLRAVLEGMFADPDYPELDQLAYFLAWVKLSCEALASRQARPGQVVALCGPANAGKSLLQDLITEILGGRVAKPYRYMAGLTDFNADLFSAEHLCIEDESPSTDLRARRKFGTEIKAMAVNAVHSCHAKGRSALSLKPFWRVTISVNDEPENLMILPPLDESLADKLMIFRIIAQAMPMDTTTAANRQAFRQTLSRELPAFVDYLLKMAIPAELNCPRYGVKHFHHPQILRSVCDMAPENRLLDLIEEWAAEELTNPLAPPFWMGTAIQFERLLTSHPKIGRQAADVLNWSNAAGTYLGRLAKKHPRRFEMRRTMTDREWRITLTK